MKSGNKKALGIITCKREDFYEEILATTPYKDIDKVFVYDSSPAAEKYAKTSDKIEVLPSNGLQTVGFAKNRLMEKMIEDGYDHLFLQEGDVQIINGGVFDAYIETAQETGLKGSLSYCHHGHGNSDAIGKTIIKNTLDYDNGVSLDFTHNSVAAFTYFDKSIIDEVGYHDEFYQNCWEHLDHFQEQSKRKRASYWWWFTDIKDSYKYIEDLDDGRHGGSVIRKDEVWRDNMNKGAEHFKKKFEFHPAHMPKPSEEQVLKRMTYIRDHYGNKK